MLALLGLLGIAFAGTAVVGISMSETETDSDSTEDTPETDEEKVQLEDLIDPLSETANLSAASFAGEADSMAWSEEVATILEEDAPADPIIEAFGDAGDDHFEGASNGDYLHGFDGDDALIGLEGDDQLLGGDGDDSLSGGDGDDLLQGFIGHDIMSGGNGDDTLQAGDGNDLLDGGNDDDDLLGGFGDDTVIGGAGNDNLQGSEGDDVVDGATGEEIAEKDYLNGSEGNDHLIGNNSDVMTGGDDADTFEIVNGSVEIMDFTAEDVLVLNYDGTAPELTTEVTSAGVTLLADGTPVATLYGLTSFDVSAVQLTPASAA